MMKVMTTTKVLKAAIYKTYIFIISTILSTERKYLKKKKKQYKRRFVHENIHVKYICLK